MTSFGPNDVDMKRCFPSSGAVTGHQHFLLTLLHLSFSLIVLLPFQLVLINPVSHSPLSFMFYISRTS